MHTLKISVLQPDPTATDSAYDHVKHTLEQRLHLLPAFRRKLLPAPFDLGHPLWIEDPRFAFETHLRRVRLAPPGNDRQFAEAIAALTEPMLDRNRPLWELWILEGLEGGRVAAVAKVHHAVADGVASAEFLRRVHDEGPERLVAPPPAQTWEPEPVPPKIAHALWAFSDHLSFVRHNLPATLERARAGKAMSGPDYPPLPFTAPATPFNRSITPARAFAFASAPLESARIVRKVFEVTINDIVLATVAGGLRRYLQRRGALPGLPLVAGLPVSTRLPEHQGTLGNRLARMWVTLATDIADPAERLRRCKTYADISKREFRETRGARFEDWLEFLPPLLCKGLALGLRTAVQAGKFSENLLLSNVPGPPEKLTFGGMKVDAFFSVGPVLEGIGLNMTAWSYAGQLNFSMVACRDLVPDLWELVEELPVALDELRVAAERD